MALDFDLVERGYFPAEIQPPYTTKALAHSVKKHGVPKLNALLPPQGWWTAACQHNLARHGGIRRQLGIPNPIGFIRVAAEIGASWTTHLEPILQNSKFSASRPILSSGPRAVSHVGKDDFELRRAAARKSARYIVHTDIQNFYPSVYTHSIAWCLHSKATAKASKGGKNLPGNRIDKAIAGCQEGQTGGIPVGPDSSLIVAECLMATVEKQLTARIPKIAGYRWFDDFELCAPSMAEAERILIVLQEALAHYQLTLNPRKTHISQLPEPQQKDAVSELRRWAFSGVPRAQRSDILAYFDRLSRAIAEEPGTTVVSYAVSRLVSVSWHVSSWKLVQDLLFQLLVSEPSCARFVSACLATQKLNGLPVDRATLAEVTEVLAVRHASLGHGSEIAWAIWMCIKHGVSITIPAADAIGNMEDNVVALLALHARASGLMPASFNTSQWEALMTKDQLRTKNWLLVYEATVKGWLTGIGGVDPIAADPFFSVIRSDGVFFYDTAAITAIPTPGAPSTSGATSSGI